MPFYFPCIPAPVNVVRLTPIPKTDDNKRNKFGNRDYDGKSKQDQNRGSTAGTQGIDTGKNAIHVPSIESASSTTSGGYQTSCRSEQHLRSFYTRCLCASVIIFMCLRPSRSRDIRVQMVNAN